MENVAYLEIQDFTPDGNLKHYVNHSITTGFPTVLMAQGNFCGYCKIAIPAFQAFAKEGHQVVAACIIIDGEPSEREASKFLKQWDPEYRGVPHYIGFDKTGKFVKIHTGGRDKKSIEEFAMSL